MHQLHIVHLSILGILVLCSLTGCAVHYFDPESYTDHLWGIGHMKMKVTPPLEDQVAVIKSNTIFGVHVGAGFQEPSISLGWGSKEKLTILKEDTAFRLEWPTSDLFDVRVGSEFPEVFFHDSYLDTGLDNVAPNNTP